MSASKALQRLSTKTVKRLTNSHLARKPCGKDTSPGPADGFLSLLIHCGADCELSSGEIVIIQQSTGKRINLCSGDDTTFKRDIADLCTDHILAALVERVNGEDSQRKDLQGITHTTALYAVKIGRVQLYCLHSTQ